MVIDAIQDWIVTTIVKKAVAKVVSMFNPAGAIVQAVLMIISVVQFVIERAAQIMEFVEAVISSIHAIATGAIGGAANWIEKSLANMIPLLIGFLAALVGLGGLAAKVKGFILKVQNKVDKAIDKVLKKIVDTVKKLFGKLKAAAKKVVEWWKRKKRFKASDESHELSFKGEKSSAEIMVASNPKAVAAYVAEVMSKPVTPEQAKAASAITPLLTNVKAEMKKEEAKQDANLIASIFDSIAAQLAIVMELGEDKELKPFSLGRPSFTVEAKKEIKAEAKDEHKGPAGKQLLKKGRARRHVVSSKDMAQHYEDTLKNKKWSLCKALLLKAGTGEAQTPVEGRLNHKAVASAAKARHSKFFNYTENIFVGPSARNSELGRRLDPDGYAPDLKALAAHVTKIKKMWAIDGSFSPTE